MMYLLIIIYVMKIRSDLTVNGKASFVLWFCGVCQVCMLQQSEPILRDKLHVHVDEAWPESVLNKVTVQYIDP